MVLRLRPEVLEDRLLPVTFHVIPVVDLTMADRVVDTVPWRLGIGERLVTDEEVEVLDPALRGEIARLCWYCGPRSARLCGRSTSRNGCWENAGKKIGSEKGREVVPVGQWGRMLTMKGLNSQQTWTRQEDEPGIQ